MLHCFGLGSVRERLGLRKAANVGVVIKPLDLTAAIAEAAGDVRDWDGKDLVYVRKLQEAVRNHGRVDLMKDRIRQGQFVAVKRMPTGWICSDHEAFERHYPNAFEKPWIDVGLVRLLGALNFPYVCRLYDIYRSREETLVSTTFCTEGDLFEWCHHSSVPPPGLRREARMRPIAVQLFTAVRWLHDLGIAHRDLSLENVMLAQRDDEASVKLIDFGMATLKRMVRGELRGKFMYQAPEIHKGGNVDTFLADDFAVGVILFSMGARDYPWMSTEDGKCQLFDFVARFGLRRFLQKRRLRRGGGEFLNEVLSPGFVDLLEALLQRQPRKRASLGEFVFTRQVSFVRRPCAFELPWIQDASHHGAVEAGVTGKASHTSDENHQADNIGESMSTDSCISHASTEHSAFEHGERSLLLPA
mmetsp:Transcript_113351/g.327361  ORF Transcript_113351/g.327361 Transcript_113351/m.327361 type:complete len:416 (-) Transcript_113351:246-1493(-)